MFELWEALRIDDRRPSITYITSEVKMSLQKGPCEKIEKVVEKLNKRYNRAKMTFGYIGNIESWGDDRGWYIWAEIQSNSGLIKKSFGGYKTEDLEIFAQKVEEDMERVLLWHMYRSEELMKVLSW